MNARAVVHEVCVEKKKNSPISFWENRIFLKHTAHIHS